MIDYDRFWNERGCAPGFSREETEVQLQQTADLLKGLVAAGHATGEPDLSQVPGLEPGPGITPEQFAAWEAQRGVRFPEILRPAFSRQDGGYLRHVQFRLLPLAEIALAEDEFWEYASYDEEQVPSRALVLRFAWDEEYSACYFLNYARGPHEEPGVLVHHHDPGDLEQRSGSITKFFERMLATSEAPSVDWTEANGLDALARETIDLSPIFGGPAEREQILGRQGDVLVLFAREKSSRSESFTKTVLPGPLDRDWARIERHRPDPIGTYALSLQPVESEGIIEHESQRTPDGTWKNSTRKGTPIAAYFESKDRERLKALRETLFGGESAVKSQSRDEAFEQLQERMQALSPEEQQVTGMALFRQMKERLFPGGAPAHEGLPPDAAELQQMLRNKLSEMEQRLQKSAGGQPEPEILRLMEKLETERDRD
jgi:hypothetical protein